MSNSIQKTEVIQGLDIQLALKHKATLSENSVPKVNFVEPANDPKKFVEVKNKVGTQLENNYKQIEAAIEDIRKMADDNLMNLGFSIDRKINTHIVTVTDLNSGKVIRQIPEEVVIRVARNLADFKGLLMDKKL
ncbi:MAG: flagellar protein FlaG [Burkholderiales bacterium]|jgi:flagellar protein FlaG